jgi:diguanylate cyclase (GGDEF)-like protein
MHGSYNCYLVTLSLVVAMLASYTTLDLAARIRSIEVEGRRRFYWLLGGAVSMGTGIWSMHFIGMLAFRMPIELGYDIRITGLSLLIAVSISYFALHVVTSNELSRLRLVTGGVLMGLGVAGMHYTGMAALRMQPRIRYSPGLFFTSIAIAIVASWVALWIAFTLRDSSQRNVLMKRFGAGLVMGLAIAGMHYTAMGAAIFRSGSICGVSNGANTSWLAFAVTGSTLCILSVTLIVSMLDTRFDVHAYRMTSSLEKANERLLVLATEDTLTGLPNRSSYMERAEQAIRQARSSGRPFTVMFMDLDGFKTINDSLGHSAGDKLLKAFSQQLVKCVRRDDTVARLGGDEFVVLLQGLGLPLEVEPIARGVIERMKGDLRIDGTPLRVTASIGIATYPQDGDSVEALLKSADMAMYDAKQNGRNTYRFFDSAMSEASARTFQIYRGLGEALEKNQLSLVFQPKFGGLQQELVGAEALIRWRHPEMGDIPPMEFIPVAERTGQVVQIGDWVIAEACRQIKRWETGGLPRVKVAINLSPEQLRQQDCVERVQTMVEGAGVEPERIMFEITETVAMRDAEQMAKVIHQFQDAGFDIAIDDFGTGYSSMAYLQQFRVKQLKIDRFFTKGLDGNGEEGLAIVSAIIKLAHSLQMVVVAEGVETRSQLIKLKDLHCDEVQGFLLAKPLSSLDFEDFLSRRLAASETRVLVRERYAPSHIASQLKTESA